MLSISLSSRIKLVVGIWFAAEALIFLLLSHLVGFPEALLIAFLTSLFGWTLLKRAGASTMVKLRAAVEGRRIVEGDRQNILDDSLATLGAVALLMPGFLSDAVGLMLAWPAARDRIAQWIDRSRLAAHLTKRRQGSGAPSAIDLDPEDWERTDPVQKPLSKY